MLKMFVNHIFKKNTECVRFNSYAAVNMTQGYFYRFIWPPCT